MVSNMHTVGLVALVLETLLAVPAANHALRPATPGQNPPGVTFELRLKDSKTRYYPGERIEMELIFSSALPKTYRLDGATYDHSGRLGEDTFHLEPAAGCADPLRDYFASVGATIGGGLRPIVVLADQPYTVRLELNEWCRFDRPGSFTLWSENSRVSRIPQEEGEKYAPLKAASNRVTFTILPANPPWAAQELQQAVAILERSTGDTDPGRRSACRTLRFLGTREAIPELVRWLGNDEIGCSFEFMAGLFGSPYRELALLELERALASPWQPVSGTLLYATSRLAFMKEHPEPLPAYPPDQAGRKAYHELAVRRWSALQKRYESYAAKLEAALPAKADAARSISAETLLGASREGSLGASEPSAQRTAFAVLAQDFHQLPASRQSMLLTYGWRREMDEPMLPALRRAFENPPGPPYLKIRDWALRRLLDAAPEEGYRAIRGEIQRPDPRVGAWVLRLLPEERLAELEETIVANLEGCAEREQGGCLETHSVLIERYASEKVLERVKAVYSKEKQWGSVTAAHLLAYLVRTDPAFGLPRVASAATFDCGGHCYRTLLADVARLQMAPALESMAISLLDHAEASVASDAANLLRGHGHPAAKEALRRRMERWHETWKGRAEELRYRDGEANPHDAQRQLEETLRLALTHARGWILNSEELEHVAQWCVTAACRQQVQYLIDRGPSVVHVSVHMGERRQWSVGEVSLDSLAAVRDKISQYPRGTTFVFTSGNPYERRVQTLLEELKDHAASLGMHIQ